MCIGGLGFAGRPVPAAADAAGLHRAGLRLRGRHALLRRRRADHLRARQAAVRVTVSLAFDRIVRVRVGDWLDFGLGDLIAACVCVCREKPNVDFDRVDSYVHQLKGSSAR